MNERERRKRELLTPLYFEAGAALFDCQGLELALAMLLHYFARLGFIPVSTARTLAILDDSEKRTAGQIMAILMEHCTTSAGIQNALEAALAARNRLIHRFLIDNVERMADKTEREALVKEIRRLRATVQRGDKAIRPFVEAFNKAMDEVDLAEVRRRGEELLFGSELSHDS